VKLIKFLILSLSISLLSSPSWSEQFGDLVSRNGLLYKRFTDVPFTGKITGRISVNIKNGKREGILRYYRENGQLATKETWKDGEKHGPHTEYDDNGDVMIIFNYKNGSIQKTKK